MTSNERRVALNDGAETTLEVWGDRGPLAFAIHGMTSSRKSWERLAAHWNGRFRVAAYDQRGHGDSAGITGPMTLARGVLDAVQVAASLREPPKIVLGHSWGGAIALLAQGQLRPARIVALDPMIRQAPADWYDEYVAELREQFARTGADREAAVRAEYADWDPTDVDGKVRAVAAMTTRPIEGLRDENPPPTWDLRDTIRTFPVPLLLAMAAPGEGINDDATLADVEQHHSLNVEIATFPGAGHNLHRTAFPALVEVVDRWLDAQVSTSF